MRSGKKISGSRLKSLREKNLMSVRDVSNKSGLHSNTIMYIEDGKSGVVRFDTIRKLSGSFGISSDEFLNLVEERDPVDSESKMS